MTSRPARLAAPLALVLAMALGLAACGGDDEAPVDDVRACLEEKGYNVTERESNGEAGRTGSLGFSKGADFDIDAGEVTLPEGGSVSFFEDEESAETWLSISTGLGKDAERTGQIVYDYENEEAKAAIGECV